MREIAGQPLPSLRLVGEIDGSRTEFLFTDQVVFDIGSDGSVAIADRNLDRVALTDSTGRRIGGFGGSGRGPGEIRWPDAVEVVEGTDLIAVAQSMNRRVGFWSRPGRPAGEVSIALRVPRMTSVDGRLFVKSAPPGQLLGGRDPVTVLEIDPASIAVTDSVQWSGCAACLFEAFFTDADSLRFQRWDDPASHARYLVGGRNGTVLDTVEVARAPALRSDSGRAWERDRRESQRQAFFERGVGRPPPGGRLSLADPDRPKPVLGIFGALGIDYRGRGWMLPAVDDGQPREVLVFDPSGELLGALELPPEVIAIDLSGRWLLTWWLDSLDVSQFGIYRIEG